MTAVGLDFGTTNSSTALFEKSKIRLFVLDLHNFNPNILPSFLYITREFKHFIGSQAVQEYLERETNRPVFWEKRKVGQVQVTVAGRGGGPITYWDDLIIEIDTAARGRLLQSIKTALRDTKYDGTQIFERFYTIEELIALIMRHLKKGAEEVINSSVDTVVIGRPVMFSENPETDARAQEKLLLAARQAGFKNIQFELEPIAAAYVYHQDAIERENVLIFDFGGGTLDMTVMEVGGATNPKVLSTEGVLIGGDDLDRVFMQPLVRYFGEGSTFDDDLPFPSYIIGMLSNWQNMVDLSTPRYREIISRIKQTSSNPEAINRLEALVNKNLGFKLYRAFEKAKIDLSSKLYTLLRFDEDIIHIHEGITRQQFESLISDKLVVVEHAIDEVVLKSGLKPDQVTAVLRTGGSSEIPAFIEIMERKFGTKKVKALSPFTTIVGGLAIRASEIS